MDGYAPLAEFWAAHGFAVLQPTHLDSQMLGIAPDDPRTPVIWRSRIEDLTRVLDELDLIEASVPVVEAEHSMGGIAGYSTHQTTDWSLERIALVQQVTTAYLHSALNLEGEAWSQVRASLANDSHPLGRVESK